AGWSVALDDVGANSDSLTLMPFLHPEFVKLDLRLVQQRRDADVATIMTTVTAYAEQSGAHVLAEGIETEVHEYTARSFGATLGQWAVVVVAPHVAAAFVARDLDDHGPDLERAFDYVLTYDRELVLEAARSVMARAIPLVGTASALPSAP